MVNKAKKTIPKSPTKKKLPPKISDIAEPETTDSVLDVWKQEVAALKSAHVADVDAAVKFVIKRTLDRMNILGGQRKEVSAFLEQVLGNDPVIRAQLKSHVEMGKKPKTRSAAKPNSKR